MIGILPSAMSVASRCSGLLETKEEGREVTPDSDNDLIVVNLGEWMEDRSEKSLAIVTVVAIDLDRRTRRT